MDGFKQGYGVRTDISGSSHPESTLQCRGKIGNDISEHVVRYDHLKIVWLPNHEQAQRIDVEMAGLNPGVAGSGILKAALPQITGIGHHIGLIAHAHFGFSGAARMIERVTDNPVHALTRVDLHLSGDFIGSTLLENAAGVDIRAFRVLTDYREVHVLDTHSFQWAQLLVEQPDRTHIGKQIQTKTNAQDGKATPSLRYFSAPQSNSTNSNPELNTSFTRRSTRMDSRVTSIPIPSPGMTAIRFIDT